MREVQFPIREGRRGHRISSYHGMRPRQTRELPWPAKLMEYPMRWFAMYYARHYFNWEEEAPNYGPE